MEYVVLNTLRCFRFLATGVSMFTIVFGYCYSSELRAGWSGVRVPEGAGNSSSHHRVQTGSGAHSAFYAMGTRGSFPGS